MIYTGNIGGLWHTHRKALHRVSAMWQMDVTRGYIQLSEMLSVRKLVVTICYIDRWLDVTVAHSELGVGHSELPPQNSVTPIKSDTR